MKRNHFTADDFRLNRCLIFDRPLRGNEIRLRSRRAEMVAGFGRVSVGV